MSGSRSRVTLTSLPAFPWCRYLKRQEFAEKMDWPTGPRAWAVPILATPTPKPGQSRTTEEIHDAPSPPRSIWASGRGSSRIACRWRERVSRSRCSPPHTIPATVASSSSGWIGHARVCVPGRGRAARARRPRLAQPGLLKARAGYQAGGQSWLPARDWGPPHASLRAVPPGVQPVWPHNQRRPGACAPERRVSPFGWLSFRGLAEADRQSPCRSAMARPPGWCRDSKPRVSAEGAPPACRWRHSARLRRRSSGRIR